MSSTDVKIFEKEEFGSVRVVMQGDDPWFVAKDVCDCLDLSNNRGAIASLDDVKRVSVLLTPLVASKKCQLFQRLVFTHSSCVLVNPRPKRSSDG